MTTIALLTTALLFGGMLLYSFGFAAFVFSALPPETAGPTIRRAFPHFYLFVMAAAAAAGALLWPEDQLSAALMIFVALTTLPSRQLLMPAITRRSRYSWLRPARCQKTPVYRGKRWSWIAAR